MVECILAREWVAAESIHDDENNTQEEVEDEAIRSNLRNQQLNQHHHDATMHLAQLHRESKKIRPMTCAPHSVSMSSVRLSP